MGETLNNVGTDVDTHSYRVPLGVCAGIAPYNFPAMIPLWMFPLAVTTGNTFVLKPSERVPLTTMLLAELARDAGATPKTSRNSCWLGKLISELASFELIKARDVGSILSS